MFDKDLVYRIGKELFNNSKLKSSSIEKWMKIWIEFLQRRHTDGK